MSGFIVGSVCFNENRSLDYEIVKYAVSKYKTDSLNQLSYDNTVFMNGLLYLTNENYNEVLPSFDDSNNYIVVADVILDNRVELIELLNITTGYITDSQILIKAYQKWEKDVCKYIRGDYAFAIWDIKKQELFLSRDHLGQRSLYYMFDQNVFSFSTTLEPLIALQKKLELNEDWLVMYLALPNGLIQSDISSTPVSGIFQCPVSKSMIVTSNSIQEHEFWRVNNIIHNRKTKTESEYIDEFLSIFSDAVKCRVQVKGSIGVSLSGGLDSTAVAAVAAIELNKYSKPLLSYSYKPCVKLDESKFSGYVNDESQFIDSILAKYPNIVHTDVFAHDKSVLSEMNDLVSILETPFKNMENLVWIKDLLKQASNDGCKVILKGQFGNITISRGEFSQKLRDDLSKLKVISAIKAIIDEKKIQEVSYLQVLRYATKQIEPNWLYQIRKLTKKKVIRPEKGYNLRAFIHDEYMQKYNVYNRLIENDCVHIPRRNSTFTEEVLAILNERVLSTIGAYDTKNGLENGVIYRDPTKDIRVIEFCSNLPSWMLVNKGIERYLVRASMKGLVPDIIRCNYKIRGLQGGDWIERIKVHEDLLHDEIKSVKSGPLSKWLDLEKFFSLYDESDKKLLSDSDKLKKTLLLTILNVYLRRW